MTNNFIDLKINEQRADYKFYNFEEQSYIFL